MKPSDSIVIIPTYNEKENIEKIVRAVFALEKSFHILVIDDGSPDGTAAIVSRLMDGEFAGRLFLLERSGKLGLGTAYITGFKWALERDYDYIFEMDADFSHDPADLPRLYSACHDEGYDVAIGSRYISGVNVVNWPIGRVLMSYFASKYVRLVTGFKVHDTTAGFKCYRRRVLQTIPLDEIRFKGYGFQIEMKYTAYKIGFKIKEVPVTDGMEKAFGVRPLKGFLSMDLICVFGNDGEVRAMRPDQGLLEKLPGRIQNATSRGTSADCVTRSFAPKCGVAEDPVCGSAHCQVADYWSKVLGKEDIVAYQASARGGTLYCHSAGNGRIKISGKAVLFAISELQIGA